MPLIRVSAKQITYKMDTEDCLEVAQTYKYIASVWKPSTGLLFVDKIKIEELTTKC